MNVKIVGVVGHQGRALGVLMGLFAQNAANSGKNDAEITLISFDISVRTLKIIAYIDRPINLKDSISDYNGRKM